MAITRNLMCLVLAVCVTIAPAVPATASTSDTALGVGVSTASVPVSVFAGADRYRTAVSVARAAFPGGSHAVVLASGTDWPDAMGGGSLAGLVDGPVLLVRADSIPGPVLDCIADLGPDIIYVLGGRAAVDDDALDDLETIGISGDRIVRLAGADRYATASVVASYTIDEADAWSGHAFVATGWDFADALSSGPVRAATGDPLFLTSTGRRGSTIASMTALGVTDVTILGGASAVPELVESALSSEFGAEHVRRIAGVDRYQTATRIAEYAVAECGFTYGRLGAATGVDFADAITAGVLLGQHRTPLLLVPRFELGDRGSSWLYDRRTEIDGYDLFGGEAVIPPSLRAELQFALVAPGFDEAMAMRHVGYLAGLGPRAAGGIAEHLAFDYIADQLRSWGYAVTVQTVYLLDGKTSHNVIAEHAGGEPGTIVLGAHVDSKPPSPGGNDNASGVGVMLETARILARADTVPTVRFVAFGAEEIGGPTPSDHHFGSRQYVAGLTADQRVRIQGMVSIDMVGYGTVFNIRSLRVAPQTVVWSLQSSASFTGLQLPFLRDPSSTGWSDHEAFEFAGIPAAWLEWRDDPVYHTVYDTAAHVQPARVRASGRLLRMWLLGMTPQNLNALR